MNKSLLFVLGCMLIAICSTPVLAFQITEMSVGSVLPMADRQVEDVSGRSLTLNQVKKANGLLVIFSCNTCPWVMKWEDRYPVISALARNNNIGMIALNPNEDYRDKGDGMADMIRHAQKADYDFPYALDKDHKIADAFGASRTPHVYLFNSENTLVYVGAIDDNANDASAVEQFYLKDAIEQMVAGQSLSTPNTKSLGCTIKRVR